MDEPVDEFTNRPELVRKRARVIAIQRLAIAMLVIYMAASIGFLVYNSAVGARSRDILLDCTTIQGECYKRQAKQTGQYIANLNAEQRKQSQNTRQIIKYVSVCQDQPGEQTVDDIERCVADKQAKD